MMTIFHGCVRLCADGTIEHWDGPLAIWRLGWGPYATQSVLGEDARKLEQWRRTRRVRR